MVAHHRRLWYRLPVRRRGTVRQCCVVSVDARPACDCDRRNPDVAAGGDEKSIGHGRLGTDCCGTAGDRFGTVLRRSRRRSAGARSCHLACLSEGGGARSESSTGTAPPAERRTPLCGRLPGLSVPVEPGAQVTAKWEPGSRHISRKSPRCGSRLKVAFGYV